LVDELAEQERLAALADGVDKHVRGAFQYSRPAYGFPSVIDQIRYKPQRRRRKICTRSLSI
jgi:hypothetical protein